MYFAYFDESGDTGRVASPTTSFSLCALLVHDRDWLAALDQTIAFRRYLRQQFRLSTRAELKAAWLVHNKGAIREAKLGFAARLSAYRAAMRFQRKAGVFHTFSVVVVKNRLDRQDADVREIAWRYAIQRLERTGTAARETIHVLPDEGHGDFIRKKIRLMRRYSAVPSAFGSQRLERKAENLVEDSSERRSSDSYFIQLADLNAYAAFRKVFPGTTFDGSVWDELGEARMARVNYLAGGHPGIVEWPRNEKPALGGGRGKSYG